MKTRIKATLRATQAVLFALLFGFCVSVSAQINPHEAAAMGAAENWLLIVDNDGYAVSWEQSSFEVKATMPKSAWIKLMEAVRKPLGKQLNRKPVAVKYTAELPGVPDGDYVVIQFETSFEKKRKAVETLTLTLNKDGAWKVSGYYIR